VNDKLEAFFKASGLKVARQKYEYKSAGEIYAGENIYAILHAPRGDATEAIVLVGAWKNMEGVLNRSGVALVLTLARYFKREYRALFAIGRTNEKQAGRYGPKTSSSS
jgi:glycosylphosphatidylinositol transamidase